MPLRDHFRDDPQVLPWEPIHSAWPTFLMQQLNRILPRHYSVRPGVHIGIRGGEVDLSTFDRRSGSHPDSGGTATATATIADPTVGFETDLLDLDEYRIRIFDTSRGGRLVAAIELVSPANKDRPESRELFVGKCAEMLRHGVSVLMVDVVTERSANLFGELLDVLGGPIPPEGARGTLYAASCRRSVVRGKPRFDAWASRLTLGRDLPALPLWLNESDHVMLPLEEAYERVNDEMR